MTDQVAIVSTPENPKTPAQLADEYGERAAAEWMADMFGWPVGFSFLMIDLERKKITLETDYGV